MAPMVQVVCEGGGVLVAVDNNTFNTLTRSAMLGAVAEFMPLLLLCVLALYGPGRVPALQPSATLVDSRPGVQQGDPWGRFCSPSQRCPPCSAFESRPQSWRCRHTSTT